MYPEPHRPDNKNHIFIITIIFAFFSWVNGISAATVFIESPDPTLINTTLTPHIPMIDIEPLQSCDLKLPAPKVILTGTENYTANGKKWVRYMLSVANRSEYPDALFTPSPNLPPCGLNTNSARTWVNIVDQDNNYLYGFCALGSSEDLDGLWFAVESGLEPPPGVKVILNDRYCNKEYISDLVQITPESFSPPPQSDIELRSRWTSAPPLIDGKVSAGEWDSAAVLPLFDITGLHRGNMYVANDDAFLYFLLDITGDTKAGASANDDYSGIAFDIGLDGFKSPYVDLRYATPTGTETLGRQWVVSESGWTGMDTATVSEYHEGFGQGVQPGADHKLYEYKIAFAETGINFEEVLSNLSSPFQARISIETVSSYPQFRIYYPSHYNSYQGSMIRIALDIRSMELSTNAPIISGIGLVPRTFIDQTTGLATTGPADQFANLQDAPFGGHMRVIGNINKLDTLNINYYVIAYCNMDINSCASMSSNSFNIDEWEFVQDVRSNYYWDGIKGKYVLDSVSPETIYDDGTYLIKAYPSPNTSLEWYFPNLLFDWRTSGTTHVNSGLYKVQFWGFGAKNLWSYIATPDAESTLVVKVDNTRPVLSINDILYKGNSVGSCSILQLDNAYDTIDINVSAYDPDGFLNNFTLDALYGSGQSFQCHKETYAGFLAEGRTGPSWNPAFPSYTYICKGDAGDHWETTCGYTFKITGWDRAINGYGRIHNGSDHETITILMPGYNMCK